MKTKYTAGTLILLLLASVFSFGLIINKASAVSTTLSIPLVTKNPGDTTFSVPVQITDVNDLYGFDIKITWDNTIITFASLSSNAGAVWASYLEPLPAPGYQTGNGYVRYAAVAEGGSGYTNTGSTTLFTITFTIVKAAGNIPYSTTLHIDTAYKLSDSNGDTISAILTDGVFTMNAATPDIYFTTFDPNTLKPYEYGKYFEVQVYATYIVSTLTGYDLKVNYDTEFMTFVQVQPKTYVLPSPTVDSSTSGVVHLSVSSGGSFVGNNGLLFTLTFQVHYDDSAMHIWNTGSTNQATAAVSLDTTYGNLDFSGGTIPIGSVTTTSAAQTITVHFIQGDVDCDGQVTVLDLKDVAFYYDQSTIGTPTPAAAKYDIKVDSNNIIDIYDLVKVAAKIGYYNPDTLPTDP